jgi:hypothetical protein
MADAPLAFWSLRRTSRDSASFWEGVAINVSQLGFRVVSKTGYSLVAHPGDSVDGFLGFCA